MAEKFDVRRFLIEKMLVEIGEREGYLPRWTSEAALVWLMRRPILYTGRVAAMGFRVGAHFVTRTSAAKPTGPAYKVTRAPGGRVTVSHPGTLRTYLPGSTIMALPMGLMIAQGGMIAAGLLGYSEDPRIH